MKSFSAVVLTGYVRDYYFWKVFLAALFFCAVAVGEVFIFFGAFAPDPILQPEAFAAWKIEDAGFWHDMQWIYLVGGLAVSFFVAASASLIRRWRGNRWLWREDRATMHKIPSIPLARRRLFVESRRLFWV